MTRRQALLAVAVLGSAVACARVERLVDPAPRPPPDEGAWAAERAQWTRYASLYDGLTMRALATATYQAPSLRQARVARVAAWKAMTPAERDAQLAREQEEAARFDEFLVSMTTADPADNDLDAREPVWRIALVVPGAPDVLPVKVEQVRPDALLRTLYPTIGDFDIVYRVRFPAAEAPRTLPFTLRIAGARGRLDFSYGAEQSADATPRR